MSPAFDPARGGPEIDETKGHDVFRRSLYFRTAPDLQMDMLKVFDAASPIECFERSQSIVPQQALALANGKLSFTVSRAIAASLACLHRSPCLRPGRLCPSARPPRQARRTPRIRRRSTAPRAAKASSTSCSTSNDFVTIR
jgi:hypothetical protein